MFHICHTDLLSLGGAQNRWQEIVTVAARELHRASTHGFLSAEIEQAKASVLAGVKETVPENKRGIPGKLSLKSTRTFRPAPSR